MDDPLFAGFKFERIVGAGLGAESAGVYRIEAGVEKVLFKGILIIAVAGTEAP